MTVPLNIPQAQGAVGKYGSGLVAVAPVLLSGGCDEEECRRLLSTAASRVDPIDITFCPARKAIYNKGVLRLKNTAGPDEARTKQAYFRIDQRVDDGYGGTCGIDDPALFQPV